MLPSTPAFAKASRFGVLAASSSVGPPGSIGRPPSPSATSITIFELFWIFNSRTSCWISMAEPSGGMFNATIEAKTGPKARGAAARRRDFFSHGQYTLRSYSHACN